jgi:Glycosyltransferase 61
MGSLSAITHAATQAVKANPVLYVPVKRFVFPLIQAARHLAVRLAAFALAQQPLTKFLLTPVRMESIANLEAREELDKESITVRTIFPDEALFDQLPTRLDGEHHWNLREYRSAAGQTATISHGRFWLPGLAVTTKNRTYLNDALFKISVHAPQNAIWGMPFTRATSLPGVSGLVAGNRPETYFHWMLEVAPKFLLLEADGGWGRYSRVIVPPLTKGFQHEVLDRFGVPKSLLDERDTGELVEAEELVVPVLPAPHNRVPAWLPREMAARLRKENPSTADALIYISRRDSPARQVENEDEVIACLEPYGFQIVTLSGMSVAAQAALFGSARVVAGPHGAGFANLLFCNPGTAVLEFFSPLYVNFCYWTLARGAGLSYFYMLGEGPKIPDSIEPSFGSVPIRVPLPALRRALNKMAGKR